MESSPKSRKIGLAIFSVFIIWHAVGITIVGPFSESNFRNGLMSLYKDYLGILHLDTSWPFYAPNPGRGSVLRYETTSASGEKKYFHLTQARGKYEHAYFRYSNFYNYLFSHPKYAEKRGYDKSVARFLCARHKGKNVISIRFILLRQQEFTYEDYKKGKRPLDKEFLKRTFYGPFSCTGT